MTTWQIEAEIRRHTTGPKPQFEETKEALEVDSDNTGM